MMALLTSTGHANQPRDIFEKFDGTWEIQCRSEKMSSSVSSVVPHWYINLTQIEFFSSKTYPDGDPFLNVNNSLPAVGKTFALSLPIFYSKSYHLSLHTYFDRTLTPNGIKDESHVCHVEFDAYGKWGGAKPDLASFLMCTAQVWQNSWVTKEITLLSESQAHLTIRTHYGDPEEDNEINCSLSRLAPPF